MKTCGEDEEDCKEEYVPVDTIETDYESLKSDLKLENKITKAKCIKAERDHIIVDL